MIDVVKDSVDVGPEEDPTLYVSEKTKRGPLNATWLEDCIAVSTLVSIRNFRFVLRGVKPVRICASGISKSIQKKERNHVRV